MKKAMRVSWKWLAAVMLVAIASFSVDGLLSIQMMRAIDAVTRMDRTGFVDQLLFMVILLLVLVPVNLMLAFLKGKYKKSAVEKAKMNYVAGVFKKEIHKFQAENTATYLSALTNDINNIEMNYIDGMYEVAVNVISFIIGILVIAYVSPYALIAGILLGALGMIISIVMGKPLERHQTQRTQFYKGYTSYIKEFLSAFHIIKSNNLTQKVRDDFHAKSKDIQDKGYDIDVVISYISASQNFIMMFIMYGLLAFSVYLAISGSLTLGGVVLIINNMEKIMQPLMQISEWLPKIRSTKGVISGMDELLQEEVVNHETLSIDGFREAIKFEDVSFSYEAQHVFDGVDLKLGRGEKILIVGPSGGGKSTLLKLIRKYFNPTSGSIKLDEHDIKAITKASYFHQLANIEQQVFIFEDTLRNNLCLYKDYSEEAIKLAIERAGLSDFVSHHPDGLMRMLYDNGKNISGGEKSRIAIARGLLQNAKIIILDEAFSSLDAVVAKEIEKTLLALDDVTVVNVSHVIFEESKSEYDKILMVKNKGVYALA